MSSFSGRCLTQVSALELIIVSELLLFKLQVVYALLIVKVPSCFALALTSGLRYYYIIYQCNNLNKDTSYPIFDTATYVILDILEAFSYFLFTYDNRKAFHSTKKKTSSAAASTSSAAAGTSSATASNSSAATGISSAAASSSSASASNSNETATTTDALICKCLKLRDFLLYAWLVLLMPAILIPVFGCIQDITCYIYHTCNEAPSTSLSREAIVIFHAISKFFFLFSTTFQIILTMTILYCAIRKWKNASEAEHSRNYTWNGKTKDLNKLVDEKFYHLYNRYIEIGKSTEVERNAIKRWFLAMYFIYLIFVLIALVHTMKVLKDGVLKNYLRILHSFFNIAFYFLALFMPFYMGSWLNNIHENYYKTMREKYLKVIIMKKICSPGNNIHPCNEDTERITTSRPAPHDQEPDDTDTETAQPLQKANEGTPLLPKASPEKKYVEYYNKAMEKNMPKITEFDFIPSLGNITIPLDSQGYTFTIILTIISIVYNFV